MVKHKTLFATRHALVWLGASAVWRAPAADQARLGDWLARDWPLVLARPQGDEPAGWLRLGAALPPSAGKRRLTLFAPTANIKRWRSPLTLGVVIAAAPLTWRPALHALATQTRAVGVPEPGVFGGFAWQALTGLPYVGPASDLDLIWRLSDPSQPEALFDLLGRWEQATGRRADGEVLLPAAAAVAWRELASNAPKVLVKAPAGVRLQARADVFAALTAPFLPCAA